MISGLNRVSASTLAIITSYQDRLIELCDVISEVDHLLCWYWDEDCTGEHSRRASSSHTRNLVPRGSAEIFVEGRLVAFWTSLDDLLNELNWSGFGFGEGRDCFSDLKRTGEARVSPDPWTWLGLKHRPHRAIEKARSIHLLESFSNNHPEEWPDWLVMLLAFLNWSQHLHSLTENDCFVPFVHQTKDAGESRFEVPSCCSPVCLFGSEQQCVIKCCENFCGLFGTSPSLRDVSTRTVSNNHAIGLGMLPLLNRFLNQALPVLQSQEAKFEIVLQRWRTAEKALIDRTGWTASTSTSSRTSSSTSSSTTSSTSSTTSSSTTSCTISGTISFIKLDNPVDLPTASGYGTAWSPDGNYMAISHWNSPFITIYKVDA